MDTVTTILIVDDDRGIRDLLSTFLEKHGYRTLLAENDRAMSAQLKNHKVDLVVLDIMLPGKSGLVLCQELRNTSKIPVIMLTAVTEEVDRILGLEMGADDYLSKPFNPRELLARIKAVLRRMQGDSQSGIVMAEKVYSFADWTLNKGRRQLVNKDGLEITLSSSEFNLLIVFLERQQQVLSRDLLLDITKNREAGPYDRSIDIQISRLRQKIEADPKSPQIIKTVRGGGYVLAVEVGSS